MVEGEPIRKLRTHRGNAVLAYLAVRLGKSVDRSHLASIIWPDSESSDAMYSLRRTLTDLRQALGIAAGAIKAPSPSTLQIDLEYATIDLSEFDAAIRLGTEASVAQAVELYRGPLLAEWRLDWVVLERTVRERALLGALVRQADRAEERGDSSAAAAALGILSRLDPHDELVFQRLLTWLARGGNRSGAQKAYDEFRTRLRQDLDIDPSPQTQDMARRLLAPEPKSLDAQRTMGGNLPMPTNPLVGRQHELTETLLALNKERIVTLFGPGGVGKTRLAMEVLQEFSAIHAQRAVAIDLLAVRDPEQLYEAFAAAVKGIDPEPNGSPGLIAERLIDVEATILLDNCEHLLEPVRLLVQDILGHCTGIRILATSQARLGTPNETPIRIAPMDVPNHEQTSYAQAKDSDVIKLMTQCLSKAKDGFQLTERNFRSVCRICGTLDGLPLAIELAATRTRFLSLDQVANLLEDRFRLLRTTDKGVNERHRTLQATMDWSYSLLSPSEQELLQSVSVFAGYWTSESAAKVHQSLDPYEILDVLERLVDRSLIQSDPSGDAPRFRLLDTVRQYASDRLAERGLLDETRDRHLQWFTDLVGQAELGFPGKERKFWLERVAAEHENIPAALAWAKLSRERTGLALLLTSSLMRYWWNRGELTTGREIVARTLELDGAEEFQIPYAKGLYALGTLAWSQGDNKIATELQHRALAIFEANNDARGAAGSLRNLSQAVRNQGRTQEAIQYGKMALSRYIQIEDETLAANTLIDLGIASYDILLFEDAQDYLQQAIEFSHTNDNASLEAVAWLNLGSVFESQGQFEDAREALETAHSIFESIGVLILSTMALNGLATIHAHLGNVEKAKSFLRSSFDTFFELGEKKGVCLTLDAAGIVANSDHAFELAAAFFGMADQMRQELDVPRSLAEAPPYDNALDAIKSAVGQEAFESAYLSGKAAKVADMVRNANRWLENK